MSILDYLGYSLLLVTIFQFILWGVSVVIKDASIVDRFWGILFILQLVGYTVYSPELDPRAMIVFLLTTLWGLRLSIYIHIRNKGTGEDYRYKEMREEHGEKKFWWYSFFSIFLLQGVLSQLFAVPSLLIFSENNSSSLNWLDYAGIGVWVFGFLFESIADYQLYTFKQKPGTKGKLLTSGLWRYSRHPNYFGECVLWWGFFLISLNYTYGVYSIFSPILMMLFIYNISGVKLLEKDLSDKKPEYKDYIKSTPAFFPSIKKVWSTVEK